MSDDSKIKWYKEQIFKLRIEQGKLNQPSLAGDIDRHLMSVSPLNPNNLSFDEIKKFEYFGNCHCWKNAEVVNKKYLYRLQTFHSLTGTTYNKVVSGGILNIDNSELTNKELRDKKFNEILENFPNIDNNTWFSLSDLLLEWNPKNQFTWWTDGFDHNEVEIQNGAKNNLESDSIINKWLIDLAYNVGLANDWLDESQVILRVRTEDIKDNLKIPCMLDALDQPIFFPVPEFLNPKSGRAIKLDTILDLGNNEFLFNGFHNPEIIEFLPVKINHKRVKEAFKYSNLKPNKEGEDYELYENLLRFHQSK